MPSLAGTPCRSSAQANQTPPVLAELGIEEMREHLHRRMLRHAMIAAVYHNTSAVGHNHVISDSATTRSVVWHGQHVHAAYMSGHVRDGPRMSGSRDIQMPICRDMWHGLTHLLPLGLPPGTCGTINVILKGGIFFYRCYRVGSSLT